MKETKFIDQHKEKWSRFEQLYASSEKNPEELSKLYMDITEDLSFSQTFYKRRTVRVYLNQLAQKVFSGVHKQKDDSFKKFFTVWRISLPLEIYRSRKHILTAFIAFLLYSFIGVLSTHMDNEFPRIILGDYYVDMTIENIQKGNPLAVYQNEGQLAMFIQITINNLKVAFLTFMAGFFFSIGTHLLLFSNGVMLGAFQYYFHLKGLLLTSFLGIWIHGAFEISAIVIAGGAGITIGNGWLFPGSYTRLQSLQLAVRRGLKIMLSLVPFIIAAGFLESYVTRNYQDLSEWSKWTLILLSFSLIIFFYVVYPFYVAKKYPHLVDADSEEEFKVERKLELNKLRGSGAILSDTFQYYRSKGGTFLKLTLLSTLPILIPVVIMQDFNHMDAMKVEHWYDWSAQLEIMMGFGFENLQDLIASLAWTVIFTLGGLSVWYTFSENISINFVQFVIKRFFGVWLANLLLCTVVFLLPWQALIPLFFILPFFMLNGATAGLDGSNLGKRLSKGFNASASNYGKTLVIMLVLAVLTLLFSQLIAFVFSIHNTWTNRPEVRDLLDLLVDFVKRIVFVFSDETVLYGNIVRQIVYVAFLLFLFPLMFISAAFTYFDYKEKTEAVSLKKAFKAFGKRSRYKESEVDYE